MVVKRNKGQEKKIALERIERLFSVAEDLFKKKEYEPLTEDEKQKYANKYVRLARNISQKYNLPIPSKYKKRFCKHCHAYFRQGKNVRVRLNDSKLVYYCLNCKKFMRQPLNAGKNNRKTHEKKS